MYRNLQGLHRTAQRFVNGEIGEGEYLTDFRKYLSRIKPGTSEAVEVKKALDFTEGVDDPYDEARLTLLMGWDRMR